VVQVTRRFLFANKVIQRDFKRRITGFARFIVKTMALFRIVNEFFCSEAQ
jgi:hypothetical protein